MCHHLPAVGHANAGDVTHNQFFNTILNAVGCRKEGSAPIDDFGDASLTGGEIVSMKV